VAFVVYLWLVNDLLCCTVTVLAQPCAKLSPRVQVLLYAADWQQSSPGRCSRQPMRSGQGAPTIPPSVTRMEHAMLTTTARTHGCTGLGTGWRNLSSTQKSA